MANPYGDCLRLLCCLWLFQAATRPRTRVIYAQPATPGTARVYYAESAADDPNITAMVAASGGDLPLIACATMERSETTSVELVTDRV